MRRFGIRLLSFCIRMASGKTIYDVTSGYRAGNRKVIAFLQSVIRQIILSQNRLFT